MRSTFIEQDKKGRGYFLVTMLFVEVWDEPPPPIGRPRFISFDEVVWC